MQSRQSVGSAEHLRQHQYSVPEGQEPLSKKHVGVRLYESNDEAIRTMGKAGTKFAREAVRRALEHRAHRHANTGPSSCEYK